MSRQFYVLSMGHIENVPKNRELVRASSRQSSATLRHKPVSIESGAPFSESTSIRCVVDAALQIFLETMAKHVAMESDDDESEELKDNDEDEDKDVFDVAKDAPPPVFSISQALSLYNDKIPAMEVSQKIAAAM
ncbi:hypothetical protein BGZ76_008167 [Entomortierella beljakovae]|nr:hypothetical protein BGZ76_008167 [Entomortierella beljakovae]